MLMKTMNAKFTKRETEELEQCKKSLIISWKIRRDCSVPKINDSFFKWCQRTNQPYVQIMTKRTFANIFMDLPNASGHLDEDGTKQFHALCSEYGVAIFNDKPAIDGVPIELAAGFANRLVQIGRDCCMRLKHS